MKIRLYRNVTLRMLPTVNGNNIDLGENAIYVELVSPGNIRAQLPHTIDGDYIVVNCKGKTIGQNIISIYINKGTTQEVICDKKAFETVKYSWQEDFDSTDDNEPVVIELDVAFSSQLDNYYDRTTIDTKLRSIEATGIDLTGYASKDYVDTALSQIDKTVVKCTTAQYEYWRENGLLNPNKIYILLDGENDLLTEAEFGAAITDYVTNSYLASHFYTKDYIDTLVLGSGGEIPTDTFATLDTVNELCNTAYNKAKNYADVRLQDYSTTSQVNTLINNAIDAIDLGDDINLGDYYKKPEVNSIIDGLKYTYAKISDLPEIDSTFTKQWVQNNYYTKQETTTAVQNAVQAAIPDTSNYVTYSYLNQKLADIETGDIDLSAYATKNYVANAIDTAAQDLIDADTAIKNRLRALETAGFITDFPDYSGTYTTYDYIRERLTSFYTKGQIDELISEIDTGEVNLDQYAKKTYVSSAIEAALTAYATKTYVSSAIDDAMADVYTKSEIDSKLDDIEAGDADLTNYYTKSEIDDKLDDIEAGDADLSNYYTKSEIDDKLDDIEAGDADLTNYYTKSEIDDKLDDYATEAYVSAALEPYATESYVSSYVTNAINDIEIPEIDTSNFYTKSEIDSKLDEVVAGDLDLSNYYTKSDIDDKLDDYATESYVSTYVTNAIDDIDIPDLTNYATKSYVTNALDDYATESYVSSYVGTYVSTYYNTLTDNIIWHGTQAQYNALPNHTTYQIYLIDKI